MIKVGIIGVTGYAGAELVRILSYHPETSIVHAMSKSFAGQKLTDLYPSLRKVQDLVCEPLDTEILKQDCDVVFTALPHGASTQTVAELMQNPDLKVIDFSADFRYCDPEIYRQWYGIEHSEKELLRSSVYGLCELHREKIKQARLIGNPGCYTTCSILGTEQVV